MRFRWTPAFNDRLAVAYRRLCPDGPRKLTQYEWKVVAEETEEVEGSLSGKACGIQASRLGLTKGTTGQGCDSRTPISTPEPAVPVVPEAQGNGLHVKKLHVHVPPSVTPASSNGMLTAVLYGDTHYPFQDESALRVVAQIIRVACPDVVVHMGDLLDTYHLSRFDHDPKRMHGLQGEVDMARAHLASFRLLAPKARFIYLEGNHEDRLRRALWSMPPHAQALMALDAVQGVLTWPKLLGLQELDIEFYAYGDQSKREFLPKFLVKHGNVVRKLSGYTARAEMDKYNKSGASGHTHRLGQFFHRDSNGNHVWLETGCTCLLNPEYAQDPDWQHGCVVMTFEPTTGAFQAETVYIHEGSATFRGVFYNCKEAL